MIFSDLKITLPFKTYFQWLSVHTLFSYVGNVNYEISSLKD